MKEPQIVVRFTGDELDYLLDVLEAEIEGNRTLGMSELNERSERMHYKLSTCLKPLIARYDAEKGKE